MKHSLLGFGLVLGLMSIDALAIPAIVAHYQVHEPGIEPYQERRLVTANALRIDDGNNHSDYTLFNRNDRMLFNVVHASQSILTIKPLPVDEPSPITLELSDAQLPLEEDAPSMSGISLQRHRLSANGNTCWQLFTAPGLLPDLVAALREMRTSLAGEQARGMLMMPADLLSACDLANHIYAPSRHLEHGLPIHSFDELGREEQLIDYSEGVEVDAALFTLPTDYQRYTPQAVDSE